MSTVMGSPRCPEPVTMMADSGFDLDGRPSKTVSDTLRTDVKTRPRPGALPRSIQHRMRARTDKWSRLARQAE
ncbi:Uncharacterised protein [Mycobacteroides abscessus subsp. massiliense]|nr:Uncharacterised protein [Mycobacteroides abscessus subsp. massiliense]